MKARKAALPLVVDQAIGVYAEALNSAETAGNAPVRHMPHDVVQGFGLEGHVVPEGVVGALALGYFGVGLGLYRVDEVRKFDGVLDEEYRGIVAHQVEVALAGVEFGGKAADVAHGVGRAPEALHVGKAYEYGRLDLRVA